MKDLKINIFCIHGPIYFNHFIYMYFSILGTFTNISPSLIRTRTYTYQGGRGRGGGMLVF